MIGKSQSDAMALLNYQRERRLEMSQDPMFTDIEQRVLSGIIIDEWKSMNMTEKSRYFNSQASTKPVLTNTIINEPTSTIQHSSNSLHSSHEQTSSDDLRILVNGSPQSAPTISVIRTSPTISQSTTLQEELKVTSDYSNASTQALSESSVETNGCIDIHEIHSLETPVLSNTQDIQPKTWVQILKPNSKWYGYYGKVQNCQKNTDSMVKVGFYKMNNRNEFKFISGNTSMDVGYLRVVPQDEIDALLQNNEEPVIENKKQPDEITTKVDHRRKKISSDSSSGSGSSSSRSSNRQRNMIEDDSVDILVYQDKNDNEDEDDDEIDKDQINNINNDMDSSNSRESSTKGVHHFENNAWIRVDAPGTKYHNQYGQIRSIRDDYSNSYDLYLFIPESDGKTKKLKSFYHHDHLVHATNEELEKVKSLLGSSFLKERNLSRKWKQSKKSLRSLGSVSPNQRKVTGVFGVSDDSETQEDCGNEDEDDEEKYIPNNSSNRDNTVKHAPTPDNLKKRARGKPKMVTSPITTSTPIVERNRFSDLWSKMPINDNDERIKEIFSGQNQNKSHNPNQNQSNGKVWKFHIRNIPYDAVKHIQEEDIIELEI